VPQRLGNGQQGFPKNSIESTSFKSFSTFKKNETLAVRFTRLLAYFDLSQFISSFIFVES